MRLSSLAGYTTKIVVILCLVVGVIVGLFVGNIRHERSLVAYTGVKTKLDKCELQVTAYAAEEAYTSIVSGGVLSINNSLQQHDWILSDSEVNAESTR